MPFLKKHTLLLLAFLLLAALPLTVLAQAGGGRNSAGQDVLKFLGATAQKGGLTANPEKDTDITDVVIVIINTLLALTGIIFFVHIFYGGFRWMTSRGNEQDVTEAKATIRTSMIGLLVVLSAYLITNFVFNQIGRIAG